MKNCQKFYRNSRPLISAALLLFLLISGLLWAQEAGQQATPPASPPSSQQTQEEKQGEEPQPPRSETKISPAEAEELFRSVDEILKFASQDSALPIHKQVKRRLTSRDEVQAYLEKHMSEDEDAQRLKRSEQVLKKFGLLPRDFDLAKFLVSLLREQVAGYYDAKTKTVNLLDWLGAEQQRPVLAHELTHALQDQSFGLEKWMKAGRNDLALKKKNPTPEEIDNDEALTARQAVIEGQAMAVLIDYMLAPTGQSLLSSPQVVEALKQGMLVGTADSVQFSNAPIFLKEVLTFPYRYGLDFVTEVLTKSGDRKSTRLNSSHTVISYAVFCLKKKKHTIIITVRSAHEGRAKLSAETLKRRLKDALPEESILGETTPAPLTKLQSQSRFHILLR